jgi:hypothetical protein
MYNKKMNSFQYLPYLGVFILLAIVIVLIFVYPKKVDMKRINADLRDLYLESSDYSAEYSLFPINAYCPTNPLTDLNTITAGSCVAGPGSLVMAPYRITYNSLINSTIYIKDGEVVFEAGQTFESDSAEDFIRGLQASVGDDYFVNIENLTAVSIDLSIFDLDTFTLAPNEVTRLEFYVTQIGSTFYENPSDAYTSGYRVDVVKVF